MRVARLLVLVLAGCGTPGKAPSVEVTRYLRVTPERRTLECSFSILRSDDSWSITSVTGGLTVEARYDAGDRLIDAQAALRNGDKVRVEAAGGRARITAYGREDLEIDVPAGVIVTSAPDWTDTFRICRLWDRARGGRQEFPGLWIHPVRPTQRLTFSAEFVRREGELEVLTIRLRGNSAYLAWVDPEGRMMKLTGADTVLVLQ
jgi:hypothetical protein